MKYGKRLAIVSAILLSLAVVFAIKSSRIFDTFNKDTLIRSAFGSDLTPYIAKEKTTYSDGCLQFHGITDSHPLFLRYFSEPFERNFHISFLYEEFDDSTVRNGIYPRRLGERFDAYVPIVAYIPDRNVLIFGYSDGIGG